MDTHADQLLIAGIVVMALSGAALIMTIPDLFNHHSPMPSVVLAVVFLLATLLTRRVHGHSSLARR